MTDTCGFCGEVLFEARKRSHPAFDEWRRWLAAERHLEAHVEEMVATAYG